MKSADDLMFAIMQLGERCRRDFGEDLHEVWVGRRVYDGLSLSIMGRVAASDTAEDPRGVWVNGLIELYHSGGKTLIRRAVK